VAETIAELRRLSDEEIIRRHDDKAIHTVVGTQHYLDELARRDAERQGRRMEALTRSMYVLSVVVTVATIIGVILTALALIPG
jgi:signal transduction histidine kinase